MKITSKVMQNPTTRLGLLFNCRRVSFTGIFPLLVFYARIDQGIKKIHRQIDNQKDNYDCQDTSLDDRNVALENGIDQ
jgi:hypothetical protein